MATRRGFLASFAAALTVPRLSWANAGSPAFLAAAKQGDGFVLCGLAPDGQIVFRIPLPARGHAAAAHPIRPEAVGFARRPGTFALVIDCARGQIAHRLTPPEGRQFNGHGAFSADGAWLFTSEVIAETSQGRIGVWHAARGYARIDEWPSHGIGPHELRRMGDGTLVVANGGIQTDPTDRRKLNLDTMRPNLTYLSAEGALLDSGIVTNRNSIPRDPNGAWYTSGIRLGTPALTTRGFSTADMDAVAGLIVAVLQQTSPTPTAAGAPGKAKYSLAEGVADATKSAAGELLGNHPLYPGLEL